MAVASLAAAALAAHAAWNLRHLRVPPAPDPGDQPLRVTVLVPARDEAARITPCLHALREQSHPHLRVLVLDDGSRDGTSALVEALVGDDPRFQLIEGGAQDPPSGWLGKPWACQRLAQAGLAEQPEPHLLVLLDADVVLSADAIGRIASLMATTDLDLASPWPRQLADSPIERLVQPLLQWSWATFLPLGIAERSSRPSLAAANGQLLAVRPQAYRRAGGHAAVRGSVLEDIALARAVRASGGRTAVVDGSDLAACRMYAGAPELVDGYTKSLWAAFGSPAGAAAVLAALSAVYVLPPLAALCAPSRTTRLLGGLGYAAAVTGRVVVATRTGDRRRDALAHPASIAALAGLTSLSWHRHRRGTLTWKGRPVAPRT